MRPFWSFLELSQERNFSGSKVHFPDLEVCCSLRADPLNLVYSVCELVHNIVFESRRVARTYVSLTGRQIYKHIPAFKEFFQRIFLLREKAFKFELFFHCFERFLPTFFFKFWHIWLSFEVKDRHAHVRIGPIMRRVRNPPIRNAHICPCDSAGYQNELLCTNSQTDYIHTICDTWAGCTAG